MNFEEFIMLMGLDILKGKVFQDLTRDGMNSTFAEDVEKLNEKALALVNAINNNPLGYVDGSLEKEVTEFNKELDNIKMYGEGIIPLNVPDGVSQVVVDNYTKKIYDTCDRGSYNLENGVKDSIADDPKVMGYNENERKKQEEAELERRKQLKERYDKEDEEHAKLDKKYNDVIDRNQKMKEEFKKQEEEKKKQEEERKIQEEKERQALEKEKAEQKEKEREERANRVAEEKKQKEAERKQKEEEKKLKEEEKKQKEEEKKLKEEERKKAEEADKDARKKIDPDQQELMDIELQIEAVKLRMEESPAIASAYKRILKNLEIQKKILESHQEGLEKLEKSGAKLEKPDEKRLSKEEMQQRMQQQKKMVVENNENYKEQRAAYEKELEKTGFSTKGLFGTYANKLETSQTSFNSSAYSDLIKKVNAVNDGKLKFKGDLTPKQKYVLQLVMIKKQIDKYIDHKAKKGVKQNNYKKLAAVEELNVEVSKRLQAIDCDSFKYNGKDVDKNSLHLSYKSEVNAYKAKNGYNENKFPIEIDSNTAQKLADRAKGNYPNVDANELMNVNNCMARILLASFEDNGKLGKYSKSINEMTKQFRRHPDDKKIEEKKNDKQNKKQDEKKNAKQPKNHGLR